MRSLGLWAAIALMSAVGPLSLFAQVTRPEPSRSLDRQLQALLDAGAANSSDPALLLKASDLYLDIGDEVERGTDTRVAAYEAGARLAQHAWQLQDSNAEAHYLYAANLGSAAQLKGVMASAFTVRELKAHVARALALRPHHAPSLHMMGMMLEELPWILGGDKKEALIYLKRAVAADPDYDHARLDLAKAFLKRHDPESARHELTMIVNRSQPSRYFEEAKQGLASLDSLKPP
jgi:tetratricopeptide (TPR) repeat protein